MDKKCRGKSRRGRLEGRQQQPYAGDDIDKPSRMSGPLSPLSTPPEDDDEPSKMSGKKEKTEYGELEFQVTLHTN